MGHRTADELGAGLGRIRSSPQDTGRIELIVRRPAEGVREVVDRATLTMRDGLEGDSWRARGSRHTPDGSAELARQLTLMNSRAITLFAGDRERWALAGDQLYVDFDLSEDNLPPGTRLQLGDALVEVSVEPHTGCAKFNERFGNDALRLVQSPEGRRLRLRGMNARIVGAGDVRVGDPIEKRFDC